MSSYMKRWGSSGSRKKVGQQQRKRWQTVPHIFFNCPRHSQTRQALIRETRSDDLRVILSKPNSAHAAARWFVKTGLLHQFQAAAEIDEEDLSLYEPLPALHTW
jgi:hypothetical protein